MGRIFRLPDLASARALQDRLRGVAKGSALPNGQTSNAGDPGTSTATSAGPSASASKPDYWPMLLYAQMSASPLRFPEPELEYAFASPRKWRFDIAWPATRHAVEVDGAVHRIKSRFRSDLEKSQAATLGGWRVLRVAPRQVKDGSALGLVAAFLKAG